MAKEEQGNEDECFIHDRVEFVPTNIPLSEEKYKALIF